MTNMEPTIETGIMRINVPEGKVVFTHPFEGPNTYREVGRAILNNKTANLSLPTGEQTAFLLDAVYSGPESFRQHPISSELRDQIMKPRYLWVFNRNLWVPGEKEGVYVQHDPKAVGFSEALNIDSLERKLEDGDEIQGVRFSKDRRTAFAPRKTYQEGEMDADDFANDGFVIASNGVEGAKRFFFSSSGTTFSASILLSFFIG